MRKQALGGRIARPIYRGKRSIMFIVLLLSVLVLAVAAQADDEGGLDDPIYPEPVILEQTVGPAGVNTVVQIFPWQDAYIASGQPNNNYGFDTALNLGYSAGTLQAMRLLMQFNFSSIPSNAIINSATLQIYQFGSTPSDDSAMGFQGQYMKAGWSESSVTWNNANYLGGTPLPAGSLSSTNGWKSGNMTDQVRAWHSGAQVNYGVIVTGDEGPERNRSRNLFSRQQSNSMPYLLVDFTTSCDTVPPTTWMDPLPSWSQEDIVVIWNGNDTAQSGCSPSGIAYYDVQYKQDNNDWANWKTQTTGNSATFKGAVNGSLYQFRTRAVDNAGNVQAWPSAQTATTVDAQDPSASVNALPEFTLSKDFLVTWSGTDNLSGIASYDVQWRVLDGEWNSLIENTPQTSYQVIGAESGVTYQLRARATDNAGNVQAWGDAQAQTTVVTNAYSRVLPIDPPIIRSTDAVTDSFEVTWEGVSAPTTTITKFDIWLQYNNSAWELWDSFAGTQFSTTFNYLDEGFGDGLYYFESVATNSLNQVEPRTGIKESQVLVDLTGVFKPGMYFPIIVK
jgi:hypothetical protein